MGNLGGWLEKNSRRKKMAEKKIYIVISWDYDETSLHGVATSLESAQLIKAEAEKQQKYHPIGIYEITPDVYSYDWLVNGESVGESVE